MRIGAALSVGLASLLAAGLARAEEDSSNRNVAVSSKPKRRSDFTLGTSGGFGFGRASGYPNEIDKIDAPAYKSSTKLGLGSGNLIWLGVAFNDYLTFGVGLGGFSLSGNDRTASASVFGFHLDAYPLFAVDKNLQDLGVFGNVGTGPMTIKGAPEQAEGGLMSYVEGGVVYERLRFWRLSFGPSASVIHMWSESATLTGALVGARLAFYSGP
jgi:hypothetical protein